MNQSSAIPSGHGGARPGSGRKPMNLDPRTLAARTNVTPAHATAILSQLIDERDMWRRVFASDDERVILDALKFLMTMRDGRPMQSINVTSMNVNITPDMLEQARSVARDIVQTIDAHPINMLTPQPVETKGEPLMLSGDEGGKEGG